MIYSQKILIPIDNNQNDHLKAYGLIFWTLQKEINVDWLLNYKNGSFIIDNKDIINKEALLRGITFQPININELDKVPRAYINPNSPSVKS